MSQDETYRKKCVVCGNLIPFMKHGHSKTCSVTCKFWQRQNYRQARFKLKDKELQPLNDKQD